MPRRVPLLLAVAVAAGTSAAAAATPVVPIFTQHQIAKAVPPLAYVPARVYLGWHYRRWTYQGGVLRIYFTNKASRDIVFIAARFSCACRAGMEKSFQLDGVKVWWLHTANEQRAWRCVNGIRLAAATSLGADHFADVGLGRVAASGHRIP